MINVIIVDDNPVQRQTIKNLIERDLEFKVTGFASNGIEVLKVCDEFEPDVVIMNQAMPVCNGVIGARLIKNTFPKIKILIMTENDNDEGLPTALQSGADGYLSKDVGSEILISTIKNTLNGESIISPEVLIP
jgi:DNA-binding NarL/FixJ family response regulator